MAYLDIYLNECPAYGWVGGSEFSTREVLLSNGYGRYNADWSQERFRASTNYLNISRDAQAGIRKVFRVCRARVHAFRFRDQLDYQANSEVFAIGDGVTTEFQLSASFTEDGETYTRRIYAIVSASITDNGSPATPVVDMRRGTVTFSVAPANGHILRWTGVFDLWVRFAQDYLPFSLDNPDATNGQVDVIEQPPPPEEGS